MNAWNDVYAEYCELQSSDDSAYLLNLSRKMSLLQADIFYIDAALNILAIKWSPEMAEELTRMGFKVDREDLEKSIQFNRSKAKRKIFDLEELHDQYTRYIKGKEGSSKVTEQDFRKNVAMLSKFMGDRINTAVVNVYEFVMIHNLYIDEYNRQLKSVSNG